MEYHTNEKLEDVKKELETNSRRRNKDLENEDLKTKLEGLIVILNKTRKELTDETKKLSERKGDLEDKMGNLRNELEEANKRLRNKDLENEDLKRTIKSLMVPSRKKLVIWNIILMKN